jgi:hypothetical protein
VAAEPKQAYHTHLYFKRTHQHDEEGEVEIIEKDPGEQRIANGASK